jgi:SAM-dependent methyltransferase
MITELEPLEIPGHEPSGLNGASHPMRSVTRQVAGLAPGAWTAEQRNEVATYFDGLADEWVMRTTPLRAKVVSDALERSGELGGLALELGAGNGAYTAMLAERFDTVVATELSREMLLRQPTEPGRRVLSDASALPIRDGVASAVVLINMFLFPDEVDRVLAPDGLVLWVNSSGEHTPIHLLPEEVSQQLPGRWTGVWARAGVGIWCALRRAS